MDAIISPLGTAFIYVTGSPRIIMAAGEMGNAPGHMVRLSAVSLITVLSYSIGPVILLHLHKAIPDAERPFRLRAAGLIAPIAFIASNWIIYWTGYAVTVWMFGAVFAYIVVYLAWYLAVRRPLRELGLREAWWAIASRPWGRAAWSRAGTHRSSSPLPELAPFPASAYALEFTRTLRVQESPL